MLHRGNSSASESSSRGRSPRPMSFPNMVSQGSNQTMNNKIQEMDKKFKHVSLAKEPKRHSLTESEASDVSTALSANSARLTGSFNNRQPVNRHHIQAMQQIRSDLDRYATFHMSTLQQQYVRDLMNEMNVDQDTAVRAIRDTEGKSIEAARETITRLLSKKMQQETQLQQVAQLHHPPNMHPAVLQQEYQQALRHRPIYGTHEAMNNLPQRGSPDGASTRADSPPVNGRVHTKHGQGNNHYEAGNVIKSQKQLQMDQNYNQLPRQYVADSVYEPRNLPTTSPPSYPGTSTNRNSGMCSPPDIGTSGIQAQPVRDQPHVYNVDRINMAAADSSEDTGVKQGHVQQMIQRMSPSAGGMLTAESGMLNEVSASSLMPEANPHQPIIKGSSINNQFYNNNYPANGPLPTARLPPSYNTAQRYRKIAQQQQQQQQSNYTASIPGSRFTQSEAVHSGDNRMLQANPRVGVSATSAINSALMGNIQQHGFETPSGNQSSMYSNASDYGRSSKDDPHVGLSPRQYAPSSSVSSNGSSIATSNDKSDYPGMHFNPNNFTQPVPRNQASGKPKAMAVGQPNEGVMDCTPSYNEAMSQNNNQQYIQQGGGHEKPTLYANQHHNKNTTFSARRDPPPYDEKVEPCPVNAVPHRQLHVEAPRSRKSSTGPRGGKPSPTTKVAEVYLNAVETNAENAQQTVVMRRPKTVESAVKAARVSAGNNKRHSGSYSAAPCSKQSNRQVDQTLPEGNSDHMSLFQDDPTIEKTITTSPVPVRRSLKTKATKGKSQKRCTDELSSDSNVSDEEEDSILSAGGQEGGESSDLPRLCSHTRRMKKYSPEAFKFYMEQHVENVIKGHKARTSRRWQLEEEMTKFNLSDDAKSEMRKMLFQKESNYIRLKRAKIDLSMFDMIKKIGVGAFGKVMLARNKTSNKLYAIKFLKKRDVLRRNQVAHVKAERDILAEADNDWVVRLYYTFQDKENLYFVMDFVPGGDMMSLLIKKEIFDQQLARFYTAELTLALESVHRMGFIHRDIKPDNILIDRNGHIKLTDFGLCTGFRWTHDSKYYQRDGHARQDSMDFSSEWTNMPSKPLDRRRMRDANRHVARSLVGTPNYIAPEVLLREGYTQLCDWWSVGVILYEMVVGHPPFHSDSPSETQMKVINFKNTLRIPSYAQLAPQTIDIIMQLCCDQHRRLGMNGGAAEVKQHSFFAGINWTTIRQMESPYKPEIKFSEDTSNFDPPPSGEHSTLNLGKDGKFGTLNNGTLRLGPGEHAFFEFTFRRFFDEDGRAQSTAPRGYYDNRDPENDDDERWSREGSKPMFV